MCYGVDPPSSKPGDNVNPKTQVQTTNLGHPPSLVTFPKSATVIFSPRSACPQIKTFPSTGHPPALVRDIMSNPARVNNLGKYTEIYNAAGQGVRLEKGTNNFVTFVEGSKAKP